MVSAGEKVISFPLAVNLLEDGQGVTDITWRAGKLFALRKYTYANLMTQAGNKNCQPLWLFKTFTGATKKTPLTAIELFLAHELTLSRGTKKTFLVKNGLAQKT